MAQPNSAEIKKKAQDLQKELNKLEDPDSGQQKINSLVTMVRSSIRDSWAISPTKLAYYEMGRVPDDDPRTARKWKMQCECCEDWFNVDVIEIDHKHGNHTFTKPEDFESYFENILNIQFKDLQRICKYKCHRVKSHYEKQKLPDMLTAVKDKINIFLVKFMGTPEYTEWLTANGIAAESSAPKRKKQGMQFLLDKDLDFDYLMYFFEACDHIMRLEQKKSKAKRFTLRNVDYNFIKVFEDFWTETGLARPNFTFTVI